MCGVLTFCKDYGDGLTMAFLLAQQEVKQNSQNFLSCNKETRGTSYKCETILLLTKNISPYYVSSLLNT